MNNRHLIKSVTPGSIAEEMEIEAGDYLLEVNGTTIVDIFDYQLLCMDEFIDVVIEKSNGEQWELEIEKDENEELGLEFASPSERRSFWRASARLFATPARPCPMGRLPNPASLPPAS